MHQVLCYMYVGGDKNAGAYSFTLFSPTNRRLQSYILSPFGVSIESAKSSSIYFAPPRLVMPQTKSLWHDKSKGATPMQAKWIELDL